MNQTKLRYEIENIYSLPTLPPVLRKLLILIEDPSISMKELGNFILKDPSITSKVIMVANSPVYGFMSRITTINQALMLLGLNSIKGILLGISVFEYMEKAMAGLWQHSIGCAVAAKIIAEKTSNPKIAEDVAISSLIHDIGKVVFSLKFPSEYEFVLNRTALDHTYIFEKEKELFEISHADVGAWLAYKWNFPQVLVETIKYHHQPSLAKTAMVHTAVVNLANILIKSIGFGFSGDIFPPLLHPQVVSLLDLNEGLLKDIVDEIDNELSDADDLMPF